MKKYLLYIVVAALALLALEGLGLYFHLLHHTFFFGEMVLLAFLASLALLGVGWVIELLLTRPDDYYKNVRERPHLIEARKQDWVE